MILLNVKILDYTNCSCEEESIKEHTVKKKVLEDLKLLTQCPHSLRLRDRESSLGRMGKMNPESAHEKLTALEMKLCTCY